MLWKILPRLLKSEDAMENFVKVAEDAMENFVKVAEDSKDAGPSLH